MAAIISQKIAGMALLKLLLSTKAKASEKITKAKASSSATIPINAVVNGPRARYWWMMAKIAAGAVVVEMAASSKAKIQAGTSATATPSTVKPTNTAIKLPLTLPNVALTMVQPS